MTGSSTLILGGVRSGKSRLAERLATEGALPVTYIATATDPGQDDEAMRVRIEAHRSRRPGDWRLIEEPIALAAALRENGTAGTCVLVDCLTLWLTNLLVSEDEALLERERQALLATLPSLDCQFILVSNETNMGIIPPGELSRRYCDEAGRLHQELAECSDTVILTVAGLPHYLKGKA